MAAAKLAALIAWGLLAALALAVVPLALVEPLRREYALAWRRQVAKVAPPCYLFAGDSLTRDGDWARRLKAGPGAVVNLAEGGASLDEITRQVLGAGDYRPAMLLVMGGTNDILLHRRSAAEVAAGFERLLAAAPRGPRLVVFRIPYTRFPETNRIIAEANAGIAAAAARRGAMVADLNPRIAPQGALGAAYAHPDGVHLRPAAYAAWAQEIALKAPPQACP